MKFFATIFAFYILFLTAIPCIDLARDNTLPKIELTQSSNHNYQNDSDHCSPFCTCDCCVSPALNSRTIVHFNSILVSDNTYPKHLDSFKSSHFDSIWQPPKLS